MAEVTIRQASESDYTFMHDLLFNTWYQEEGSEEKIAYTLAEIDLNHVLNQSTFGLIAEKDDENLGFILAKVKNEQPVLRQLQSDPYRALKVISDTSQEKLAEGLPHLLREHEINNEMLEQAEKEFDAEICLFIMSPKARGMGIGSQLYQKVIDYFDENNVKHYYLFTDDGCNFQFYESRQMYRSQTLPFNKEDSLEDSSFNYYLYENTTK